MYLTQARALNREWREKQAAEIQARDEASKARRQETILKAEKAIDAFYEDYASKKQKTIRDNKYVCFCFHTLLPAQRQNRLLTTDCLAPQRPRKLLPR